MSDINVTPLVDVMLVLLVIFIVTAPLRSSAIRLNLPQAQADGSVTAPDFVTLSLQASGEIFLNDQRVTEEELPARLAQAAADHRETELQLRADQAVPYGTVARLMGIAHRAGLSRIGFVTDAPPPVR